MASGAGPPRVGLFLLALDPTAFATDYLPRVEDHLVQLRDCYGIDFGRHGRPVVRMQLADHLYHRLIAAAGRTRSSEGDMHA